MPVISAKCGAVNFFSANKSLRFLAKMALLKIMSFICNSLLDKAFHLNYFISKMHYIMNKVFKYSNKGDPQ